MLLGGGGFINKPYSSKRDDIIGYIHTRLGEDADPDAMDSSLQAVILYIVAIHLCLDRISRLEGANFSWFIRTISTFVIVYLDTFCTDDED